MLLGCIGTFFYVGEVSSTILFTFVGVFINCVNSIVILGCIGTFFMWVKYLAPSYPLLWEHLLIVLTAS